MSEVNYKSALVARLKEAGLDLAEDVAGVVVEAVFDAAGDVVEATPNKYDDMMLPVLALVKPKLLDLVDKIDGEVGS